MNIFVLDLDPKLAARYHCDKHVIKMILESAQLLSTAINDAHSKQVMGYKSTHRNHPCSVWVSKSRANAQWLLTLVEALNLEYRYRYNRSVNHKSYDMLLDFDAETKLQVLPDSGKTDYALAMPDQYKSADAVESYRNYYSGDKTALLQYTKREQPEWLRGLI